MPKSPFHSLKISLILPYALLIIAVSVALSSTYYWSATRNVSEFSRRYIQSTAVRIGQSVRFRMDNSRAMLKAAFPQHTLSDTNISKHLRDLRTRFWIATSLSNSTRGNVYYANKAGQNMSLTRLSNDEAQLRVRLRPEQPAIDYRYQNMYGEPRVVFVDNAPFDARGRFWYEHARQTDHAVWTAIYADHLSGRLVITRARRILTKDGHFAGVVGTDVALGDLNKFLTSLDVGSSGRAFLVDKYGQVIAAPKVFADDSNAGGSIIRMAAVHSSDPVIRAAYKSLMPKLKQALRNGTANRPVLYDTTAQTDKGQRVVVAAQRVVDDSGLNWLAVVAVPRNTVLASINRQFWIALGISIFAVLLAIALGIAVFGRIARDVRGLSKAVSRVRGGALEMDLDVRRQDEVGDLARNFEAMHTDLFTDRLTGIANRTALNSMLRSLIEDERKSAFTLFFIDLNRFKPLNDRYGHDNGDRALREVAQRLQSHMRPGDFVARLGGDEFVVIAANVTESRSINAIRDKFVTTIQSPLHTLQDISAGQTVSVGAAIGHATWPGDAEDADDLIKCADERMYSDKRGER